MYEDIYVIACYFELIIEMVIVIGLGMPRRVFSILYTLWLLIVVVEIFRHERAIGRSILTTSDIREWACVWDKRMHNIKRREIQDFYVKTF